jgi:hypothetical protein
MSSIAQVRRVLKGQVQAGAAAFTDYWTDSEIERACRDCGHAWRDRFWTPLRTLWGFLLQVLHADSSCREAVALVLGGEAAAGPAPECSADPSAYGQARRRLPLEVFRAGVRQIGQHGNQRTFLPAEFVVDARDALALHVRLAGEDEDFDRALAGLFRWAAWDGRLGKRRMRQRCQGGEKNDSGKILFHRLAPGLFGIPRMTPRPRPSRTLDHDCTCCSSIPSALFYKHLRLLSAPSPSRTLLRKEDNSALRNADIITLRRQHGYFACQECGDGDNLRPWRQRVERANALRGSDMKVRQKWQEALNRMNWLADSAFSRTQRVWAS